MWRMLGIVVIILFIVYEDEDNDDVRWYYGDKCDNDEGIC